MYDAWHPMHATPRRRWRQRRSSASARRPPTQAIAGPVLFVKKRKGKWMGDLSTGDFAHGFFLTLEASSIHFRRHLNVHLISMIIIMPPSVLCVPQCPPAVHTCSERCTHAPAG